VKASESLARMLIRAPASKTSRARSRRVGECVGCGVRACSFRRVSLALERRERESGYEVLVFSFWRIWDRSRSDILAGVKGGEGLRVCCWLV